MATKQSPRKKEKQIQYQIAPVTKRFISYLIDWYVGALCTAIPIAIISQKLTNTMLNQNIIDFPEPYGIIAGVLAIVFAIFYFIIVPTYINKGQTFGKKVCHIKIVRHDNQEVTIKNMILRQGLGMMVIEGVIITASAIWHQLVTIVTQVNFVTPLMYVGFAITAISVINILRKGQKRALHDYIGGTKVVSCQ